MRGHFFHYCKKGTGFQGESVLSSLAAVSSGCIIKKTFRGSTYSLTNLAFFLNNVRDATGDKTADLRHVNLRGMFYMIHHERKRKRNGKEKSGLPRPQKH